STAQHQQLIHTALENVKRVTGFCGRWEVISHNPLVVCETAHNADGVHAMLQKLNEVQYDKLHLIYGCVSDKDFSKILQMLPQNAQYYYTQPSVPRALPAADLAATASQLGMAAPYYPNIGQAYQMASKQASPTDMILITGSIFLVADALKYFKQYSLISQ
ncbi:MAG: bifunctional folylpolyglutamate synthase/dihydrofolate synthase, partial [Bacteroidales bacterium]|nr:bifunctional folylpolyglutamate synthase/dihydrofolate synthase [Candidatus Colimorpha onthohippi]